MVNGIIQSHHKNILTGLFCYDALAARDLFNAALMLN
jgi:hypothetical protein